MAVQGDNSGPFWAKAAAATFGAWALAVPIAASIVTAAQTKQADQPRELVNEFKAYVITSERRLVLIEERQARMQEQSLETQRQIADILTAGRNDNLRNGGRR